MCAPIDSLRNGAFNNLMRRRFPFDSIGTPALPHRIAQLLIIVTGVGNKDVK